MVQKTMSERAFLRGSDKGYGICGTCGMVENLNHVEPDARGYMCRRKSCGPNVMGFEEALIEGVIDIKGASS